MWEYKRTEIKYRSVIELIDQLNNFGKEHWEIVYYQEEPNINNNVMYIAKVLFKRLKNE